MPVEFNVSKTLETVESLMLVKTCPLVIVNRVIRVARTLMFHFLGGDGGGNLNGLNSNWRRNV
jgi:hypothetical protein